MGRWHQDQSDDDSHQHWVPSSGGMPLARGNNFGPYEILALVGKGGMGEVYCGYDTNRSRDIAIKVLPASGP
jgi:serine/threonine protein kinase